MSFTVSLDGPGRVKQGRPVRVQVNLHDVARDTSGLLTVDWGDQRSGGATTYFPTSQAFNVGGADLPNPFVLAQVHVYLLPGTYTITATVRSQPASGGETESATLQLVVE